MGTTKSRSTWAKPLSILALAGILLVLGASTAGADALPGTPAERANTNTPLPPGGDQCSFVPDQNFGWGPDFDFNLACYAHDVCYANHALDGVARSRSQCDSIFLDLMLADCRARGSGPCQGVAYTYHYGVRAFGGPAYNGNSDPPVG